MRNEPSGIDPYNDTVSSRISTMTLRALEIYKKETSQVYHIENDVAIARAFSQTLKEFITIYQMEGNLERNLPVKMLEDVIYMKHFEKSIFIHLADDIFKGNDWRVERRGYPYTEGLRYSVGILKLRENKE